MDSRGTHGSPMARDSIREQKPLCNCDRNWTGYSTGEVRTFLERDPVPGGCRVANTGYALAGLRPAGKALGGLDVRDGGPHQGRHLPPRSAVAAAEAVAVRQRRPGVHRTRKAVEGRVPDAQPREGAACTPRGQAASVRQSPARKRGRYSAASR